MGIIPQKKTPDKNRTASAKLFFTKALQMLFDCLLLLQQLLQL
jgi:hypothetical protein